MSLEDNEGEMDKVVATFKRSFPKSERLKFHPDKCYKRDVACNDAFTLYKSYREGDWMQLQTQIANIDQSWYAQHRIDLLKKMNFPELETLGNFIDRVGFPRALPVVAIKELRTLKDLIEKGSSEASILAHMQGMDLRRVATKDFPARPSPEWLVLALRKLSKAADSYAECMHLFEEHFDHESYVKTREEAQVGAESSIAADVRAENMEELTAINVLVRRMGETALPDGILAIRQLRTLKHLIATQEPEPNVIKCMRDFVLPRSRPRAPDSPEALVLKLWQRSSLRSPNYVKCMQLLENQFDHRAYAKLREDFEASNGRSTDLRTQNLEELALITQLIGSMPGIPVPYPLQAIQQLRTLWEMVESRESNDAITEHIRSMPLPHSTVGELSPDWLVLRLWQLSSVRSPFFNQCMQLLRSKFDHETYANTRLQYERHWRKRRVERI